MSTRPTLNRWNQSKKLMMESWGWRPPAPQLAPLIEWGCGWICGWGWWHEDDDGGLVGYRRDRVLYRSIGCCGGVPRFSWFWDKGPKLQMWISVLALRIKRRMEEPYIRVQIPKSIKSSSALHVWVLKPRQLFTRWISEWVVGFQKKRIKNKFIK